ncbi:glycosyltransferase family 2 protein [Sulfuriroseicoccus oceanibius]|uniref:Glycosyltransferase n=1 Tax=Sulfuriroseicoccus oceanibius TaxID=2707525 RepID=A0A6B3L8D5_9BACT|nr:glycosyltransferase [Sulfuriroseicoccus oceanibius]QQL44314.1 glycosyltransferase [Sulfuriroseicoccus oceanibius]
MNVIDVSVISPVYNVRSLILETADSVLAQRGVQWEWILVDDGSDEETRSLLRELEERDCRIRVLLQANQGAQIARNRGLGLATGEYVKFLDSDDLLGENQLRCEVMALRSSNCSIAVSPYRYLFDRGGRRRLTEPSNQGSVRCDLLQLHLTNGTASCGALTFKRSLVEQVGGWDESLSADQDGDLVFRCALVDNRYVWCGDTCFVYREHDRAPRVSKGYGMNKIESRLRVTDRTVAELKERGRIDVYRDGFAHRYDWIGRQACIEFPDIAQGCFDARDALAPDFNMRGRFATRIIRRFLGERRAEKLRRLVGGLR